jgi:hypothetical protein
VLRLLSGWPFWLFGFCIGYNSILNENAGDVGRCGVRAGARLPGRPDWVGESVLLKTCDICGMGRCKAVGDRLVNELLDIRGEILENHHRAAKKFRKLE